MAWVALKLLDLRGGGDAADKTFMNKTYNTGYKCIYFNIHIQKH